jgi:monothiol glutaredoxin
MPLTDSTRQTIEGLLGSNRVVLFMKGTPQMPQCGFSANAAGILGSMAPGFASFNVLEDAEVREGIKEYGDWPTIPQLYIDQELVGGSDIISQMFNSGELHEMLGMEKPDRTPPVIEISEAAAAAISQGMDSQPGADLHFKIDDYWRAQFMLQPASGGEVVVESGGIKLHLDIITAERAKGVVIDFVDALDGTGLTVDIPQAPPMVKHLSVGQLKGMLEAGDKPVVVDIRSPAEREKAQWPIDVVILDEAGMQSLAQMPKDTVLVFTCHHGNSSQGAAEHYRKEGFTDIYNLDGGIDAWAREIDTSVATY